MCMCHLISMPNPLLNWDDITMYNYCILTLAYDFSGQPMLTAYMPCNSYTLEQPLYMHMKALLGRKHSAHPPVIA